MDNILIIEELFDNIQNINNFFSEKDLSVKNISEEEFKSINSPKSTLICHKNFENKVNGKSGLMKVARNFGSTKIIVLNPGNSENYLMENEMGGSFVCINYLEFDALVKF